MSLAESIEIASNILADATNAVVFTGAGISAESGVPTYRGHGGATWSKYDPSRYANIDNFFSEPEYFWSFFQEVRSKVLADCHPNPGHEALTKLQKRGIVHRIITQNIDGLHQLSGSQNVIELHGNTRFFDCLDCGKVHSLDDIVEMQKETLVPKCQVCGGVIKPRVIFFGDALDVETLQTATEAVTSCDVILIVGSTLQVYPAAQLPIIAAKRKKPIIIANYGPTELDPIASCRLEGKASEILPALVDSLSKGSTNKPKPESSE